MTRSRDVAPVQLRAAADEVIEVLGDAIRSGLYEVGQRLPPEQELALKLGVSRPVLREALGVLRRAGVVSVRRGATGGTFVESLGNLSELIAAELPGLAEARPLLEARRSLEPAVALLAAERATAADLRELDRLVEALVPLLTDPREFFEIDVRFHLYLGQMSRNHVLAEFHRTTMRRLSGMAVDGLARDADVNESLARQRRLAAAVASKDASVVVHALDEHLAPMEEYLLGERLQFPMHL
jgi:GntR family transcriptional regulator, transcriptional repressor for pyruvate dehydrogenase complex